MMTLDEAAAYSIQVLDGLVIERLIGEQQMSVDPLQTQTEIERRQAQERVREKRKLNMEKDAAIKLLIALAIRSGKNEINAASFEVEWAGELPDYEFVEADDGGLVFRVKV